MDGVTIQDRYLLRSLRNFILSQMKDQGHTKGLSEDVVPSGEILGRRRRVHR